VEERVAALLKIMTLEEKAGQIVSFWLRDTSAFDAAGNFISSQDTALINRGIGSFSAWKFRGEADNRWRARCINNFQKYLVEKTRLGIPAFIFNEALHGLMVPGATSFPQAIALGSTWDTTLVEQVFTVAALEGRARGTRQVLSPVLDLARDPRWGAPRNVTVKTPTWSRASGWLQYMVCRAG